MRKRTIKCICDNFMWYLIYLLPLLCFGILLFKGETTISLLDAFNSLGLGVLPTSDVYVSINSIFGVGGLVPLFASTDLILYFSYFVCVYVVHLCVDFLLFIPRLAHKWLSKMWGAE